MEYVARCLIGVPAGEMAGTIATICRRLAELMDLPSTCHAATWDPAVLRGPSRPTAWFTERNIELLGYDQLMGVRWGLDGDQSLDVSATPWSGRRLWVVSLTGTCHPLRLDPLGESLMELLLGIAETVPVLSGFIDADHMVDPFHDSFWPKPRQFWTVEDARHFVRGYFWSMYLGPSLLATVGEPPSDAVESVLPAAGNGVVIRASPGLGRQDLLTGDRMVRLRDWAIANSPWWAPEDRGLPGLRIDAATGPRTLTVEPFVLPRSAGRALAVLEAGATHDQLQRMADQPFVRSLHLSTATTWTLETTSATSAEHVIEDKLTPLLRGWTALASAPRTPLPGTAVVRGVEGSDRSVVFDTEAAPEEQEFLAVLLVEVLQRIDEIVDISARGSLA